MSITHYFTKSAAIKRLTVVVGNTDKSDYQTASTIACNVQQTTPEEAALVEGVFGKTFNLFCPLASDIIESDRVTIDAKEYTVKGVKSYNMGNISYKKAIIVDNLS